jgi:DNA-binding CsgD family transcriptional regulator
MLGLAWLNNGSCRYEEALEAAEQGIHYPDDLGLATWSNVELIEAAVRSNQMVRAITAFHRLSRATRASGSDWALGIEARCRALLTDGSQAEPLYRESIELLKRSRVPMELARAHLLYGEWLRRVPRRVDARRELQIAFDSLSAMGLGGFAERARRELVATGESVRKRSVEARKDLTPQEMEIAQLASSGFTNVEIGARLFISERTVEWHLSNVFLKLGIRSRRQLRDMVDGPNEAVAPASMRRSLRPTIVPLQERPTTIPSSSDVPPFVQS